jgi:hypothetical protein
LPKYGWGQASLADQATIPLARRQGTRTSSLCGPSFSKGMSETAIIEGKERHDRTHFRKRA